MLPWKSALSLLMNKVYSPAHVFKASAGEEHAGKSSNVTLGRFKDLTLPSMLFCFHFFNNTFALSCHVQDARCNARGSALPLPTTKGKVARPSLATLIVPVGCVEVLCVYAVGQEAVR